MPPATVPRRVQWMRARTTCDIVGIEELGVSILKATPNDALILRSLGRLMTELDRHEDAQTYWRKIRDLDANDFEAAFHVANALVRQGNSIESAVFVATPEARPVFRNNLQAQLEECRAFESTDPAMRHVAICGVSYSGSTLLDRLLGSLPGVASIGESHWLTKARYPGGYAAIDYGLDPPPRAVECTVCGGGCPVLTWEFRRTMAADHTRWYFRIAKRVGTNMLVSADKNPQKLIDNDPLLRFGAIVLFKEPADAWASELAKRPAGRDDAFYAEECRKYLPQWAATYDTFLHHFRPQGPAVFCSLRRLTEHPAETLEKLCILLSLPFDAAVLQRATPGHAIGGNARAVRALRSSGYAVEILPLVEPDLPLEHRRLLEKDEGVNRIRQALLAAERTSMDCHHIGRTPT